MKYLLIFIITLCITIHGDTQKPLPKGRKLKPLRIPNVCKINGGNDSLKNYLIQHYKESSDIESKIKISDQLKYTKSDDIARLLFSEMNSSLHTTDSSSDWVEQRSIRLVLIPAINR